MDLPLTPEVGVAEGAGYCRNKSVSLRSEAAKEAYVGVEAPEREVDSSLVLAIEVVDK